MEKIVWKIWNKNIKNQEDGNLGMDITDQQKLSSNFNVYSGQS